MSGEGWSELLAKLGGGEGLDALKSLGGLLKGGDGGGLLEQLTRASATAPGTGKPSKTARERPPANTVRCVWESEPKPGPQHRLATDGRGFLTHEVAEDWAACGEPIWLRRDLGVPPEAEAFLARGASALGAVQGIGVALRTIAESQLGRDQMVALARRTVTTFGLGGEVVQTSKPAPAVVDGEVGTTAPETYGVRVVDVVPMSTTVLVVQSDTPPRPGDVVRFDVVHGTQPAARVRRVVPKDPGSFDLHVEGPAPVPGAAAWVERREAVVVVEEAGVQFRLELHGEELVLSRSDMPGAQSRLATEDGDALRFADLDPRALNVLAKLVVLASRGERLARKAPDAAPAPAPQDVREGSGSENPATDQGGSGEGHPG